MAFFPSFLAIEKRRSQKSAALRNAFKLNHQIVLEN